MITFYLVRHACTEWNLENRIQGSRDLKLSPLGERQARRLAQRLKKEKITLIYSSDMKRTEETAKIVRRVIRAPLRYEKGLREIHLGQWEGKTPEEVNRLYRNGHKRWLEAPSKVRIPGAEPVTQFRKRVLRAFRKLLRAAPEGKILIVTHGGVIATFLSILLKGNEDQFLLRLRLDNAGLSILKTRDRKRMIVCSINDTSHLEGLL